MKDTAIKYPPVIKALIAIVIFELSGVISIYLPGVFFTIFRLIGVSIFIFVLFKYKFVRMKGSIYPLFVVFMIWTLFILFRGSMLGNPPLGRNSLYDILYYNITYDYSALGYFMPLIALFSFNSESLFYGKKIGILLALLSLLLVILNWQELFVGSEAKGQSQLVNADGEELAIRMASNYLFLAKWLVLFLLFNYGYKNSKLEIILPVYFVLSFLTQVLGGGRGASFLGLMYILIFIFILFKYPTYCYDKTNNRIRSSSRYFAILGLFMLAYGIYYLINNTTIFDFLFSRAFVEGTIGQINADAAREVLRSDFVNDFNADPLSWLFGRGVNGTFQCSISDLSIMGRRSAMEWGYLYYILKGGVPYLAMYVFLILHAAYLGLRKSKNTLCKAAAFICILSIVQLVTVSHPGMTMHFFMTWFCFGLLENDTVRNFDDMTVNRMFNYKVLNIGKKVL